MIDPSIQAGADRQAGIEAAKAAFFNSGGQVHVIPGIEVRLDSKIRWNRNDMAMPGSSQNNHAENADAALAVRIRELAAKGAGVSAIKHALHVAERRIHRIAEQHGIVIQAKPVAGTISNNARTAQALVRRRRREGLAQAIRPIAAQGMSLDDMAAAVGVSRRLVTLIIEEFGIQRGQKAEPAEARRAARERDKRAVRAAWL